MEADLKRVTDPQLEAAAHEVRTSRWFLSHEVALSALIRPTVNVRNAHVVEFFRTSSIDGVVYLTTPFVEPVLAIEWDGADPAEDLSLRQEKRHADFAAQLYIIRDLVHAYVSAVWKLRIREKCEREHVPYPAEAAGTTYRHPKAVLKTEMRRLGLDDTLLVSYDITELDGFRCPNALVLTHCGERHFETYGARCRFTVIPQRELDEITLIACASDIAEGINNFVRNEPQKEMSQFS